MFPKFHKLFSNNSTPPVRITCIQCNLLTEGMFTRKDDILGHFQSFDFRINEEIKYCLRHNLPRAHLGLARLVANWLVGWWLWRATCISQDTYLLYFMTRLKTKRCHLVPSIGYFNHYYVAPHGKPWPM